MIMGGKVVMQTQQTQCSTHKMKNLQARIIKTQSEILVAKRLSTMT